METFTPLWNELMAFCVFVMLGLIALLFVSILFPELPLSKKTTQFVHKQSLWIGLAISLGATLASLVYSNVIGYAPCLLCWYGRIAFYPQVVLYGLGIRKRDKQVVDYSFWLTLAGVIIAGYHYIIETVGYSPLPCSANGASCLTRYVYELGFISIPLMELVPFVLLLLVVIISKKANKISTK